MGYVNDDTITQEALRRWSTSHEPRLATLMTALVSHIHAFAREVELTNEEWQVAMQFLTQVGRISNDKRQEFNLLSDVLGLSMLCVMRNGALPQGATPQTVLGPFHVEGSPHLERHECLPGEVEGAPLFVRGTVCSLDRVPIEGSRIDFWQADAEGAYETQIPDCGPRLRGIYHTDAAGRFSILTIVPKGYSIPMDGPVGDLMRQTDISYYRPAHLHAIVSAPGYETIVTQIFQRNSAYLEEDAVFGVREQLIADFVKHSPGPMPDGRLSTGPYFTVDFDFTLSPGRSTRPGFKEHQHHPPGESRSSPMNGARQDSEATYR